MYDIMSELNIQHRKGLLLLLDFEKAFDSLEWHYIKKYYKNTILTKALLLGLIHFTQEHVVV